jgi:hypothetical protein
VLALGWRWYLGVDAARNGANALRRRPLILRMICAPPLLGTVSMIQPKPSGDALGSVPETRKKRTLIPRTDLSSRLSTHTT